ncbi:FAD-binding oxidoreductase [Hyphomicrobium sp. CS1GBMeth3]|uniref:FAD-binding oxidoreductase n=1 Tax=Hyphomicrobium sp. CS1GBMeth3 TaxID=1892845 RepID=UPI000930769C|nr:FAD-binding oxidoreductase [Hyphomicrobium sp. CS1GBMeth3]
MDIEGLKSELAGLSIEENPNFVRMKSRDAYWFSPILKGELDAVMGDLVVTPRNEAEVVRIAKACYAFDVPLTVRGGGTGNYGQAMPLSGGVVLDMTAMSAVKSIAPGRVVAEGGAIIADIDRQTRAHSAQELRMHPSTHHSASIGGFVAGGSSGIGSITWGGLRDPGNIIRLRVVTMEAEPRVLDLFGDDIQKVAHAYGTNGILTEVEMPLAPAYDWVDMIVEFDRFMEAAAFANDLGAQDGLLTKLISVIAAPIPYAYFKRHQKFLSEGKHAVLLMLAPHAVSAFEDFAKRYPGTICFRSDADIDTKGLPPIYELSWNHTTLRAMKVDTNLTYLQSLYPFPNQLALIEKTLNLFGDEVPLHLEFLRFDGNVTCFGLPLVRYSTAERLEEIMRIHEANGVPIFNPHRYTLEEGGMKRTDETQLAFKKEADPKGLLNPGKMIAWENPDFDFDDDKIYLYPGLRRAVG